MALRLPILVASLLLVSSAAAQTYRTASTDPNIDVTLELRQDHSYSLQNRGDSCWVWWDEAGTWFESDGIRLTSESEQSVSRTRITAKPDAGEGVWVEVVDEEGRALKKARVTLNHTEAEQFTDDDGVANFSPHEVRRENLKWLEVSLDGRSIGEAVRDVNGFVVTLDLHPKLKRVVKQTLLVRVGDDLREEGASGMTYYRVAADDPTN